MPPPTPGRAALSASRTFSTIRHGIRAGQPVVRDLPPPSLLVDRPARAGRPALMSRTRSSPPIVCRALSSQVSSPAPLFEDQRRLARWRAASVGSDLEVVRLRAGRQQDRELDVVAAELARAPRRPGSWWQRPGGRPSSEAAGAHAASRAASQQRQRARSAGHHAGCRRLPSAGQRSDRRSRAGVVDLEAHVRRQMRSAMDAT